MQIQPTSINGVFEIILDPIADNRGLFMRSFCKEELVQCGLQKEIVQINQSNTNEQGVFRGFHFQNSPYQETKIVRCLQGAVCDIIIDIRQNSETFLRSLKMTLTSENNRMIFIPEGIAHGFQTLTSNCQLLYLHTQYYNPSSEDGLNYLDPMLKIELPMDVSFISDRDKNFKFLTSNFKGI